MPQMGIQPVKSKEQGEGKGKKERERHRGNQSSDWLRPLLFRRPFDKTWRSMGNTKLCSVSSPDSYQNQAFLSAYLVVYTSLRWFTSSSGQKGQLTFYSLFSDKGLSTRRLICVDLPKVWCHSQKALNKFTFLHSKDTAIYNKWKEYSGL